MATRTFTYQYSVAGTNYNKQLTATGTAVVSIDGEQVADSQTDFQIVLPAIDVSAVKSCVIISDQAVLIETNDGTTPDNTLTLNANDPYIWRKQTNQYDAFKFTVDIGVNGIYVTNSSGSTATIYAEFVLDATP